MKRVTDTDSHAGMSHRHDDSAPSDAPRGGMKGPHPDHHGHGADEGQQEQDVAQGGTLACRVADATGGDLVVGWVTAFGPESIFAQQRKWLQCGRTGLSKDITEQPPRAHFARGDLRTAKGKASKIRGL